MSGQNDDPLAQNEMMIYVAPGRKQEKRKLKASEMPTLDKLAARCVMATGLTPLTPRLTAQESFCELLRWWKDKIMESSGMQLTDYEVVMKKRANHYDAKIPAEIAFTAHDGSGKPLGYVHFMNRRDGKGGTVTVAVRDVTPLQPSMVVPDDERPKEPQDVRFTHRSELGLGRAVLNFLGAVNQFRRSTVPQGSQYVPFQPHPETDSIFNIGPDKEVGRSGRGKYIYRTTVTPREFNIWCECALFLQGIKDDDIVKTEMGDLILDPKSRGKIYFKSFLLSDTTRRGYASLSKRPLRYGYNIIYGTPDEMMKHMSSLEEECRAIMSI
ncbi:hypothetical protein FDENT_6852 [Fusarium denticulatum]|uniref:Uncharacterized protein n=1 Tax=Fusarium denticulatum TaxID=48507 RepID=A0A8H5X6E2_9HYPO|nr:hypothetical protein FDENT_6852 [Fusarium denticulatum]